MSQNILLQPPHAVAAILKHFRNSHPVMSPFDELLLSILQAVLISAPF